MDNKQTSIEEPSATPQRPGRALKIIISIVLRLHLTAIVSAPASSNGSPLFESLVRFFRPYLEAAYLNHGYQFFAPEPGPGVEIERDGKTLVRTANVSLRAGEQREMTFDFDVQKIARAEK